MFVIATGNQPEPVVWQNVASYTENWWLFTEQEKSTISTLV